MNAYHVLVTIISTNNTAVNKVGRVPALMEMSFLKGKTDNEKINK